MPAHRLDARLELRGGHAKRDRPHPRAAALELLGDRVARIGAEVGDFELEPIDEQGTDGQVRKRQAAKAPKRFEAERQSPRAGAVPLEHDPEITLDPARERGAQRKLMQGR